jgi:hypothetical protein
MVTLTCDIVQPRLIGDRAGGRPSISVIGREHAADGFDRRRDPLHDLAVDAFERAGAGDGLIKVVREQGTVGTERMNLARQRLLAAVGLVPTLGRRLQRVECKRQTPARNLNRIGLAHAAIRVSPGW